MKIQIIEEEAIKDTEITIRCRQVNEEILKMVTQLRAYGLKITGSKDGSTFILDAAKILYIDTVDKKTFFYTKAGVFETPLRLYELEERLEASDFFRASKSTIINFRHIKSLRPEFGGRLIVTMSNDEKMYVSRQYAGVIKEKLGIGGF